MPGTVLALILTHNAPEVLLVCVRRVLGQLSNDDRLLIVDNASTEPAEDVVTASGLGDARLSVMRLHENLGPAGGYARGLAAFLSTDSGLVWIVDDDMLPHPGALDALRAAVAGAGEPVIAFPSVVDSAARPFDFPAWCGVLIPRRIVEVVGGPREDYFWWAEDTEYLQWRIPRAGFGSLRVPSAKVTHEAVRRGRRKPAWKFYYETRNMVHYRVRVQIPAGVPALRCTGKLVRTLLRTTGRIALVEDGKLGKLAAVIKGARDGWAERLGVRYPVGRGTQRVPGGPTAS